MADNSILPKASAPLVDQTGRPTRAFYTFFNALVSNLQGQISSISKLVKNLALVIAALGGDPDSGEGIPDISGQIDAKADKAITITGMQSIQGGGDLSQNRFIYLDGDVDDVPGVSFYGSPDGNVKGWTAFSANFTPSMDADDNVTLDLVTVEDAGGGTLQRTAFDAYGRKTGTSAATTTDLTEGSNLYFTDERAQDAAGAALDGTGNVPLTYDDAGNKISAALSAGVLASLALADSATQPGDLATVATTGAYADLSGLPTLGTAAATDATDYATAAQGTKADSAVQTLVPGTNITIDDTDPQSPVISATGGGGGSGDVVGPASAVDGDLVLFDGITGKLIKSGGGLAAAVRAVVLTGLSLATSAVIAATDTVLQAFGKLQAQITDNLLPAGYIDGLKMVWVSGTALTVTTGAAYIPGLGKVLRATSDIAKTGLSLSASTWYHVYLYDNAGTPDVEIVTTAPAAPYNGTARSKTGDTSRRYAGSVRTKSSGGIAKFTQSGLRVAYLENIQSDVFGLVNAGAATTATTLDCSGATPVTATNVSLSVYNNSTVAVCWLSNADCNFTMGGGGNFLQIVGIKSTLGADMPMASDRTIQYMRSTSDSFGVNISAVGYLFER